MIRIYINTFNKNLFFIYKYGVKLYVLLISLEIISYLIYIVFIK